MDDFDLPDLTKIDDPNEYFKQLKRLDEEGHLKHHRNVIARENAQIETMDENQRLLFDKLLCIMAMPILRCFYYERAGTAKMCSVYGLCPSVCWNFVCTLHSECIVCGDSSHSAVVMFLDETFTQCTTVKALINETKRYMHFYYTLDDVRKYLNK